MSRKPVPGEILKRKKLQASNFDNEAGVLHGDFFQVFYDAEEH
jgi:hypothetical protein